MGIPVHPLVFGVVSRQNLRTPRKSVSFAHRISILSPKPEQFLVKCYFSTPVFSGIEVSHALSQEG
jgi:hypothetical protein